MTRFRKTKAKRSYLGMRSLVPWAQTLNAHYTRPFLAPFIWTEQQEEAIPMSTVQETAQERENTEEANA